MNHQPMPLGVCTLHLADLGDPRYRLLRGIPITIEMWGEFDYNALWNDIEAWGWGKTPEEAVDHLRECIIVLCDDPNGLLRAESLSSYGQLGRKWAGILRGLIAPLRLPMENKV